jgi:hypothetical protein
MTDDDILRRDVLLALGATGAASAGAGVGSLGAFIDEERSGASFQAGGVDLVVRYEGNDETVTVDSGGVGDGPELTLPDPTESTPTEAKFCFELRGNPAYIWLCPGISTDLCSGTSDDEDGLLDLSLAYCDVNASESQTILEGSLCEFLEEFEDGIPLDGDAGSVNPGSQEPFQPTDASGENPCLCLSLAVTGDLPAGAVDLGLNLRFHAVQARHNDGETGPCATPEPPEPPEPTPTPTPEPDAAGISFVAFCNSTGNLSEDDVQSLDVSEEDGAPALTWETEVAVEHVVLKSGIGSGGAPENPDRGIEVFDYPSGERKDTVRVGEGDPAAQRTESTYCLEGDGIKIERAAFEQYR